MVRVTRDEKITADVNGEKVTTVIYKKTSKDGKPLGRPPAPPPPLTSTEYDEKIKAIERAEAVERERIRLIKREDADKQISRYRRTVYFNGCDHRVFSFVASLKPQTYYFCPVCVLFRKISEINY